MTEIHKKKAEQEYRRMFQYFYFGIAPVLCKRNSACTAINCQYSEDGEEQNNEPDYCIATGLIKYIFQSDNG